MKPRERHVGRRVSTERAAHRPLSCPLLHPRKGPEKQWLLTKGQEESVKHSKNPGVPAFVFYIQEAVHSIASQQGEEDPGEVPESHL